MLNLGGEVEYAGFLLTAHLALTDTDSIRGQTRLIWNMMTVAGLMFRNIN